VRIAAAIAKTDTGRAVALVDSVGGPAFDAELAKVEIAYKIGVERPDEAIKIIEGIRRDRRAGEYQAAALGWLAVALAPRDRARAFGLVDRALAMMIVDRNWMDVEDEIAVATRIAICARRLGYPDMESVIMRVMATRSAGDPRLNRDRLMRLTTAALALALLDPETARTVLERIEAQSGRDPTKDRDVREPWLMAWALVDLKRAKALFEAGLTALDGAKEVDLWSTGFFQMVELLVKPPHRRDDALGERSFGGFWWPVYQH
jgi:hypothetical protein